MLIERLPVRLQTALAIISNLLILFSLMVILLGSWKLVLTNMNAHSVVAKIPIPLLYGVGIATAIVMGVIVLLDIVKIFQKKNQKEL